MNVKARIEFVDRDGGCYVLDGDIYLGPIDGAEVGHCYELEDDADGVRIVREVGAHNVDDEQRLCRRLRIIRPDEG